MKKVFLSALAATALFAPSARAQTSVTWSGATDTTFLTGGNWVGNTAPANSTTTNYGIFSGTPTTNQPNMTATRSIAGLDFQSAGWTLSGASTLTVGAFGIDSAGSGTNTVSAPVTVGVAGGNWSIGTGNTLNLSGILTMSNAFTVDGGGILRFSGSSANTGSGAITVASGTTIEVNKVGVAAFGTGINVINGTVKWLQANAAADVTGFTVNAGGVLDLNNNNVSFAFSGNTPQFITLSGGTVQTGTGTWLFTGNNAGSAAIINGTTVSTITGITDLGSTNRSVSVFDNASGVDFNWAAKITDVSQGVSARGLTFSAGSGTPEVVLGGNNDYRGTTLINSGVTVYADHANALGDTAGGTTIASGGTLALRGGINYAAENLVLNIASSSTTSAGLLRSVSGNNTWNGTVSGNNNSTSGTSYVIQVDADSLKVNGSLAYFSPNRSLAKTGAGALIYDNAANNINGPLFVNGGVFAQAQSGEVNVRGSSANTALNGGTIAAPDNITMPLGTGGNQIRFGANGGGFAAYGGDITVDIGSISTLVWGGATTADAVAATRTGAAVTALTAPYFSGAGYTDGTVSLVFSGGGGTGAAGTVTFSGGVVSSVNLTNGGSGYTSAPAAAYPAAPTGDGGTTNFLANGAPLILNSTISANKVTMLDNIDLAASGATFTGQREIQVLDNTGSSADRAVIDSVISSSKSGVGINKTGAGVLEYATGRTMTYSGATTVSTGTLLVNGTISGTGAVTVGANGTLGGTGSLAGATTTSAVTSVIAPGVGAGKLTLNSTLNLSSGVTFKMELGSATTAGTTYDQLAILGALTGSGTGNTKFEFTALSGFQTGAAYTLLTFGSKIGLDYADLNATVLPSGYALDTGFGTGGWMINGTDLQAQFAAVPEPATWALLAFSLTTVMVLRRRKQS